jgi:ABC-type transporter Mla subunit MlaD
LGIIGTFLGLIVGLQAFTVSENPTEVRHSLEALLHGVFEAFTVSALAITLAMIITFIEKWLVAGLYKKNEKLCFLIDSMFEAGAGEEYLARLVTASEDSADQSKILKDALVRELDEVLSRLTDQQIQAQSIGNQALGQQIVESLTGGLTEPLTKIADAVQLTSKDQGQAVTQLLTDVLAGFSQRLQELFGGQINGINQMQQQTIDALQAAVSQLQQMAGAIETAGTKSTDAMAQKLSEAVEAMEARQSSMNDRMADFVEQLRGMVKESQSETNQKLQQTLAEMGEATRQMLTSLREESGQASMSHIDRENRASQQMEEAVTKLNSNVESLVSVLGQKVEGVVGTLQKQSQEAIQAQVEREQRMQNQSDQTIEQLTQKIDALMTGVKSIAQEIRASIEAMRTTTSDTVGRMNAGAETLYVAANEFSKAGTSVTGVLQQSANVVDKLTQAAGSIGSSTQALQGVVSDYATTRETLSTMLDGLRSTVENAKREAALTEGVLARIESATKALGTAQQDAETYLRGVSQVLADAQSEFQDNLRSSLTGSYTEFHTRLSQATGLLRQAIEELALAVENPSAQAFRK